MATSKSKQVNKLAELIEFTEECFQKQVTFIEELEEGKFCAVYRIDMGRKKVVLKIAPALGAPLLREERNSMASELDAMRLLRSQKGIPAPQTLRKLTADCSLGAECFFSQLKSGESYAKKAFYITTAQTDKIYENLGEIIRRLHGITGKTFGRFKNKHSSWTKAFISLLEDVLFDAADASADIFVEKERILQAARKHSAALGEVQLPVFLHRDLSPANILVNMKTLKVSGLVDWERSLYGDPLMDLVFAGVEGWQRCKGRKAFNKGYGREGKLKQNEKIRIQLYSVYHLLLAIVEGYYRNSRDILAERQWMEQLEQAVSALEK